MLLIYRTVSVSGLKSVSQMSSDLEGEKKSNPNSFWNKIKNFGGKNVGEAG